MSNGPDSTGNDELWSVALPNGQIQKGTLDQLDEAFQAGLITSDSLVLAPGETTWAKLGELAGLEAPAAPPPPTPVSFAAPISFTPAMVAPNTMRPVMMDVDDLDMPAPRSKKGLFVGAMIAVAALGGIGALAFTIVGGVSDAETAAAALAAQQKPTATASVAATAPPPPPPAADDTSKVHPLLTDAQKKALLDADEARARLSKAHQAELAAARGPTTKHKGIRDSAGFASPRKGNKPCSCKHGDPLCSCM